MQWFSWTFDTVDHDVLLGKLSLYGIQESAYDWFKSYLNNRTQKCVVNGSLSKVCSLGCWVSQGTILGPPLFFIYRCPKRSFLYFISLYFSTIGLGKQIISSKVVSFNIIHYFHTCCAIFWLEYSICVLPRQRCASIFSSHIFFVFHSPNSSNSFLVFCEYHER